MKANLKTLIVDDYDVIQFLHTEIAKMSGLSNNPLTLSNGYEALNYLHQDKEDDNYLILLDINMPVMDGWGLLEALPRLPENKKFFVVMVTSSSDNEDRKKALANPYVISFLEKPIREEDCAKLKNIDCIKHFFI